MVTSAMIVEWVEQERATVQGGRFTQNDFSWVIAAECDYSLELVPQDWLIIYDESLGRDDRDYLDKSNRACIYLVPFGACEQGFVSPRNGISVFTDMSRHQFTQRIARQLLIIDTWERTLMDITVRNGSFQDLIDASESILQNYITMTNASFRLVANTRNLSVQDPWIEELVKNGFHSKESIDRFRRMKALAKWSKQHKTQYSGDDHFTKYPIINHIFHLDTERFLQLVMSCNNTPYSKALFDTFEIFVRHIDAHIRNQMPRQRARFTRHSSFLLDLIAGKQLSENLIEAQSVQMNIGHDDQLILYALTLGNGGEENIGYLLGEMNAHVPSAFVVRDNDLLYVLIKLNRNNTKADLNRIEETLTEFITYYSAFISRSEVIPNLLALKWGSKQARIALELTPRKPKTITYFSSVFYDYLIKTPRNDIAFLSFCIKSSFLGSIQAEDSKNNTHDYAILETYLSYERRLEKTANALALHRNTVSQRIARITHLYELDLDDEQTRRRIAALFVAQHCLDDMTTFFNDPEAR